jgi:hypothetical protein
MDDGDHDTEPQPALIDQLQLLELTADAVDERPDDDSPGRRHCGAASFTRYCSSPRLRRLIEPLRLIGRDETSLDNRLGTAPAQSW